MGSIKYAKSLTIAIPVFNGGDALIQSVKSCYNININYKDFEVLIVDNCSNDNSIEKLHKYKSTIPIRIVKNEENFGRIGNWNRCLDLALGKYILFLFSNELISEKNNISEMVNFLDCNKKCSFISSPWIIANFDLNNKQLPKQFFKRSPGEGCFESKIHIKSVIEEGKLPFVPLQSNLMRMKNIINNNLIFDDNYSITADGIFLSQLAISSNSVGFNNNPSIIWRYDAPGRMHGEVDIVSHIDQMFASFSIINILLEHNIDIKKSVKNYNFVNYIFPIILKAKSKKDLILIKIIFSKWLYLIKKYNVSILDLLLTTSVKCFCLIFKVKTLFKVIKSRYKK